MSAPKIRTFLFIVGSVFVGSLCSWLAYHAGYSHGEHTRSFFVTEQNTSTQSDISKPVSPKQKSIVESPGIHATTAREIETFGSDMVGQRVQMVCEFEEVSQLWVEFISMYQNKNPDYNGDDYVGVSVVDQKGDEFTRVFTSKAKYGHALLKLKDGDKIRIIGIVCAFYWIDGPKYFILADDISW